MESSSPASQTSDDGVRSLASMVFSGDSNRKRRVSSIMMDLNSLLESPEEVKKRCFRDLEEILDPSGNDVEVDMSIFKDGCKTLHVRHQESLLLSPFASPQKNVSRSLDFRSPLKCLSPGPSLSDSDISMCSSPSPDLHGELNRLKEDNKILKLHVDRLETLKAELLSKLDHAEDKNAELEIVCRDLDQWKRKHEQRVDSFHDVQLCETDLKAKDSKFSELLQDKERVEKELAKEKILTRELEEKISDLDSVIADKEELQIHAESLHKLREDDLRMFEQTKAQVQTLERQLLILEEINETSIQRLKVLEEEKETLEGFKTAVKYYSRKNDELVAMVEHYQVLLPAIPCDTSDDEESCRQLMSLKDELGGSLSPLNTTSDAENTSFLSTSNVEADHDLTPAPAPVLEEIPPVPPEDNNPVISERLKNANEDCQAENVDLPNPDDLTSQLTEADDDAAAVLNRHAVCERLKPANEDLQAENVDLPNPDDLIGQWTEADDDATVILNRPAGCEGLKNANEDRQAENLDLPNPNDLTSQLTEAGDDGAVVLNRRAGWHITPWRIILGVVFYLLHNVVLSYLVLFIVIFVLNPYLDQSHLLRARPWFLSDSEGTFRPPPL